MNTESGKDTLRDNSALYKHKKKEINILLRKGRKSMRITKKPIEQQVE